MRKLPLIIAGIIFSLIAFLHLLRLIYHWPIIAAGYVVPMSASFIGLLVTVILAVWMFVAAMKN